MTRLDEILEHKRAELAAARAQVSAAEMAARAAARTDAPRGFRAALQKGPAPRVIAELKPRSPSRGALRPDFDPVALARQLDAAGATALSVLTDKHFFGASLEMLQQVRRATRLPLLRKDFIVDRYQIDEARAAGADAVLLIVAALDAEALEALLAHARGRGLDALVEVHDEAELARAAAARADLIGVNNRDLKNFSTDLGVSERLAPKRPAGALLVSESGILENADLKRLTAVGADAFLVGEALMRAPDVGRALERLRGQP